MRSTVKVGTKGQIVIPARIRKEIGIEPGQKVHVAIDDGRIVLHPIPADLIAALSGCLADGPSVLDALKREHAEEVRRDAEGRV